MANQISVNTGSGAGAQQVIVDSNGNITVTVSRSVIGTVANVASANYANFAGNVVNAAQPNITSVGTLSNLTVSNTITTNNLVVTGNFSVGNLVANNANFANFAGNAFAVAGANVTGAVANATFATTAGSANTANSATVANSANAVAGANVSGTVANATFATTAGTANTANSATVANSANAVAGANVSGTVANATYALNAGNANFANSATVASSANSVTLANVSGAGNIASINLDGSSSNVLYGNGIFAPAAGGNTANANYANFAGNAFSVDGSNVVGAVANATFALDAGNANIANIAYSVDGANVSGTVANATFALDAGNANIANIAYSVDGANVSGTVANATFALDAGNANIANIAYSVDAANVSGLGNIATINLDGNASNFLDGTGNFVAAPGGANANYANFAGQAIDATQSNITQTGNLVSLTINNNVADTVTNRYNPNLIAVPTLSNFPNAVSIVDNPGIPGSLGSPAVNYIVKGRPGNAAASNNDVITRTVYGAKGTGGNILFAGDTFNTIRSAPNVANAYVAGQVTWRVPSTNSNLANANTNTLGQISFNQAGTFSLNAGAPGSAGMSVLTFGTQNAMIGNAAAATAFTVTRRRGNNDASTTVEPNDYLGDFVWQAVTATQAGTQTARIRPRIDSGYTAGSNLIPIGFEIQTVGNANNTNTHFLYANGNVQFANVVTATTFVGNTANANYANFAGNAFSVDGANVSGAVANANIANIAYSVDAANVSGLGNIATINLDGNASNLLDGTGNFVAIPSVGTPNSIQNGNSIVQFSGPDGSLLISTNNLPNAIEIGGRNIALYGANTGGGDISKIDLINGALNWQLDNTQFSGGTPFGMTRFNTGFLEPLNFYTARGNASSQADVQAGDTAYAERVQVRYDGNTAGLFNGDVAVRSFSPSNTVAATYSISATGDQANSVFQVNFGAANVAGDINATGNINVNSGNVIIGADGRLDYLRTFGSFTSNATQTSNGANTTNYMTLNNTEDANGISIASSTQITVARTGRYNIQFSAQVEKTSSGTDFVEIWLDKNGTAVANSATQLELAGNNAKAVAAWDFNVNAANVNDYFRLAWASPDVDVQITAVPTANTISGVAIPSVIVNVNPVGA